MSDVQALLARCLQLGATFTPGPDGKLKVKAPAPLPEELREELRRRKAEIMAALRDMEGELFPVASGYSCPSHPGRQCRHVPLDPDPYQEGLSPVERLAARGLINLPAACICNHGSLKTTWWIHTTKHGWVRVCEQCWPTICDGAIQ